jgi:hypothetical protein
MHERLFGRYADPTLSPLELAAAEWLEGFYQLEHLFCTRAWAIRLCPHASAELKFSALLHDAERHFPGGPTSTPTAGFDDPDYLFAHSIRSADIVEAWLRKHEPKPEDNFIRRVRSLVLRHEVGGNWEEDLLQAADSISFLETLDWLAVEWVHRGIYSVAGAREKLTWMLERIRPSLAASAALPHYLAAVRTLEAGHRSGFDYVARRRAAGDRRLLLGLQSEVVAVG